MPRTTLGEVSTLNAQLSDLSNIQVFFQTSSEELRCRIVLLSFLIKCSLRRTEVNLEHQRTVSGDEVTSWPVDRPMQYRNGCVEGRSPETHPTGLSSPGLLTELVQLHG